MKKNNVLAIACALLLGLASTPLRAQERGEWSMTVGADAVSHYLWRGMELGGPSIQPSVYFDYEKGDWAVGLGAWGTKSVFKNRYGEHYNELDLSVEASWRNLTLSLADYGEGKYFGPWQEGHFLDFGLSFTLDDDIPLTFSWYSIINQTFEGGFDGGSGFDWAAAFPSYFEMAYDFSICDIDFSVAAGLWPYASGYYENEAFGVCNLNLSVGYEFELCDDMALPVSAQVMYNPAWNEFFWGVGVGYYFSLDF